MRIGLISCTKSKTDYPAPARELYQPSALFRGALAYLEHNADVIYVLSAKYGLLSLDQVAEPYDQTLKTSTPEYRREWARKVLEQIQQRHGRSLSGIAFEFHAGDAYSAHLRPLLEAAGATCTSPVDGLPIGGRLHFYATGGASQPRRVGRIRRRSSPTVQSQGWYEFPVNPAEVAHGKARREMVIPAGHEVRRLGQHGVYMYFDGPRCLYVGKASASTLVGRALDYLYEEGGRPEVYRVIREHATRLMIRGVADDAAARRVELAQIVAREPVLNEGFIYASPAEKVRYGLGPTTEVAAAVQVTGIKIHAAVWLAAALLHEEGHATFSPARLVEEVERRFGDRRPGVQVHVSAHCVANAQKNTGTEYSYLYRTENGELRLFRQGDQLHPSRSGIRTAPDQTDVPAELCPVWRKWQ